MNSWFKLQNAKQWLFAIEVQGGRLLRLQEEIAKSSWDESEINDSNWQKVMMLRPIEEHFFVISVNKAIQWLLECEKHQLVPRGCTKPFRKTVNLGTQVRNMREHDTEYFNGRGGKQASFEYEVLLGETENAKVDASSTIITNEGYLIGGRLNVQHAIKEAIELYPYLEHEQANLPEQKEDL